MNIQQSFDIRMAGLTVKELSPDKDISLLNEHFSKIASSSYEHVWANVLAYNTFDSRVYLLEGESFTSVAMLRGSDYILLGFAAANPERAGSELMQLQKNLPEGTRFSLQALNHTQIAQLLPPLKQQALVEARSLNEVYYSTAELTNLSGKKYEHLRQVRNKVLQSSSFAAVELNTDTLPHALEVLTRWQTAQGDRYVKNKQAKEAHVLTTLAEFRSEDVLAGVCYWQGKPQSYYIVCLHPAAKDTAVIYLLKGINRKSDGGVHGITDATYLHVAAMLREKGIEIANDGDLGSEAGTIRHKLSLHPCKREQYFNLILV